MRESAGIRVLTPGLAVYTNLSRSGEEIEPRIGAFESDFGINSSFSLCFCIYFITKTK